MGRNNTGSRRTRVPRLTHIKIQKTAKSTNVLYDTTTTIDATTSKYTVELTTFQ